MKIYNIAIVINKVTLMSMISIYTNILRVRSYKYKI